MVPTRPSTLSTDAELNELSAGELSLGLLPLIVVNEGAVKVLWKRTHRSQVSTDEEVRCNSRCGAVGGVVRS